MADAIASAFFILQESISLPNLSPLGVRRSLKAPEAVASGRNEMHILS